MAILGKLRSKGVLLLIIVGAALLAFIVGDFISNSTSFYNERKAYVGKINGEKVKLQEFNNLMNQMTGVYKLEYGSNSLPDDAMDNIRQGVWDEIVTERTLLAECEKIGIAVPHEELNQLILGNNPSPLITGRRAFVNPETGVFDPTVVASFVSQIDNDEFSQQVGPEELENWRSYWKYWENAVKVSRLQEKYTALLSKSMVVNSLEAQDAYNSNLNTATIVYTIKPFMAIDDANITINDSEVQALYNKRKEQYKQEKVCDIQYVALQVAPSAEDFAEAERQMAEQKNEFQNTTDAAEVANYYSDEKYIDSYLAQNDCDEDLKTFAFSANKDSVFGPLLCANNTYKMARLVETMTMRPDSVKIRHIVIARKTKKDTEALRDSLLSVLNAGGDFAELAKTYSLVQTSKNGGEIGWVREYGMTDQELCEKAFTKPVNELFTIENAQGAIQILQVTERGAIVPKVKLATIIHEVTASSKTHSTLYQQAKQIASNAKNAEEFAKVAEEANIEVLKASQVEINGARLNNLKQSRPVIKWAFENKVGAVSDVFECDKYIVVANVTNKNESGYSSLDAVREQLESELRNEKKGEQIKNEINGKTIETLIAQGYMSDTVTDVTFSSPYAGSMGSEPKVFALIPTLKEGQSSTPIVGNNGVYVIKVIKTEKKDRPYNEKEEKAMLGMRSQYVIPYLALQSLKDRANVEDARYRFY